MMGGFGGFGKGFGGFGDDDFFSGGFGNMGGGGFSGTSTSTSTIIK